MKKIVGILLILMSMLCLFACGDKFDEDYVYDGHSLVGKWQEEDYDESGYISYEFFDDGKFEMKEYSYGIELHSEVGTYTAEGNKFVVTFKNYDGTYQYVENKFCITEDNELVMIYLDKENEMEEKEMVLIPFEIDFVESNAQVVGTWEDIAHEGELWKFNKDYTGTISNGSETYAIRYSVHDDYLYIATELIPGAVDNLIEYEFDIDDGILTIEAEVNNIDIELSFRRK